MTLARSCESTLDSMGDIISSSVCLPFMKQAPSRCRSAISLFQSYDPHLLFSPKHIDRWIIPQHDGDPLTSISHLTSWFRNGSLRPYTRLILMMSPKACKEDLVSHPPAPDYFPCDLPSDLHISSAGMATVGLVQLLNAIELFMFFLHYTSRSCMSPGGSCDCRCR